MNKFTKLISNNSDGILKRRATTISQTAEIAQQNLVNDLKQKKAEIDLKIDNLTDLAPETTDSLRPGSKDWDPAKWAKELQQAKQNRYMLEIQLKLAQETYDEYFKEGD